MKFSLIVVAAILSVGTSPTIADAVKPLAPNQVVYKVGKVTWHAKRFEGKRLAIQGYLLVPGKDYVLFSDEASGAIGPHDLPVTGPGIIDMKPNVKYLLVGTFIKGGLVASNGNPDHFELSTPPTVMEEKQSQ